MLYVKVPGHAVFVCFYIGLYLILYLKSLSRNSALVQNYGQSHNELSSGRAISVSVALNAKEERGGASLVTIYSKATK